MQMGKTKKDAPAESAAPAGPAYRVVGNIDGGGRHWDDGAAWDGPDEDVEALLACGALVPAGEETGDADLAREDQPIITRTSAEASAERAAAGDAMTGKQDDGSPQIPYATSDGHTNVAPADGDDAPTA